MFRNYVVIAWRSLIKNRLFSFINIFSLSLAISVGMMVMIRVMDSFSYDRFHPQADRTYRVTSQITNPEKLSWQLASTPLPLRELLMEDSTFGSIVSLYPAIHEKVSDGTKEFGLNGTFTQSSFFDVFGFRLLHGDASTALAEPFSVVLGKASAERFFGANNPVGKLLTFERIGACQITGVLDEPEGKSHIDFDLYISFSTAEKLEALNKLPQKIKTWDSFENAYTYVVLPEKSNEENLNAKLEQIAAFINKESSQGTFDFKIQPLSAITPGWGTLYNDIANATSWGKVLVEMGVAFIILLAACFNYTNLSIARALTRAREVGVRKVAGARRSQIFLQYIVESVVVAFFALLVAVLILSFILEFKPFNDGYEFIPDVRMNGFMLTSFGVFALFAGLLAGAIPSWILSSFKAVRMLRNSIAHHVMGGMTMRKVLLVFQFSVSLVVLIFLSAFYKQFSFMESTDHGFRRENIISIPLAAKEGELFKNEISRISGVEDVAAISTTFGRYPTGAVSMKSRLDNTQAVKINYYFCDRGVIPVSGLRLVAGKNFTSENSANERSVILNRKAIEVLGFVDIHSAIGEPVWLDDSIQVSIAGVIENFYNEGVGNAIAPLALRNKPAYQQLLVLTSSASVASDLENTWKKLFPGRAFSFAWLDSEHRQRYDQSATISLLGFLAFMTVTIASLGLLGLVVYTVETRRKEISVRKIIGASVRQLVILLSRGFTTLLLIAGCIAIPIGYALSTFFLMNFANRVEFGVSAMFFSFAFLLTIGLTMIISQTYKASTENPANNLRSE